MRRLAVLCSMLLAFGIPVFSSPNDPPKPKERVVLMKEVTIAAGQTQSTHSVKLTWADGVNASGTTYNAYKASGTCPASGTPPGATKVNTTAITGLTFTESGIAVSGTFCYYVTAVGPGGESAGSNTAAAVIPAPPAPPTNLTIQVTSP